MDQSVKVIKPKVSFHAAHGKRILVTKSSGTWRIQAYFLTNDEREKKAYENLWESSQKFDTLEKRIHNAEKRYHVTIQAEYEEEKFSPVGAAKEVSLFISA